MTSNAQCCPYPTTLLASVEPCLPTNSHTASTRPQWAYEIKRDGNRFVCRRDTGFGKSPGAATIGLTGAAADVPTISWQAPDFVGSRG